MPEENECAWCRAELHGQGQTGIGDPILVATHPDMFHTRYCSKRCIAAARSELFHRRKHYGEKWPRFCAEVPPELALLLDATVKHRLGINRSAFSRANVVRAALRRYLDEIAPVDEPTIEVTGTDVIDVPTLNSGD